MFSDIEEFQTYLAENFIEVTDARINEDHWDLLCTHCNIVRGFNVLRRDRGTWYSERYGDERTDYDAPVTYLFTCPVCKGFKHCIVYEITDDRHIVHYYRVSSVPSEGSEEIAELPGEPRALREAYRQAIRAMDANAHLAAAAMFRRAVQVITRDILKVRPGNLAAELREAVGKPHNGGVVGSNFQDVGYIIKEAGNQAAHPDGDPDLLDFTPEDATDLQSIFMELVSELFVIPAAKERAKVEFLGRRKIVLKSSKQADR